MKFIPELVTLASISIEDTRWRALKGASAVYRWVCSHYDRVWVWVFWWIFWWFCEKWGRVLLWLFGGVFLDCNCSIDVECRGLSRVTKTLLCGGGFSAG